MGTDFAPPYACLCLGYLEETRLFPSLRQRFSEDDFEKIMKWLYRYIDDGFEIWPRNLDIRILIDILNELHPKIKFEFEYGKVTLSNECYTKETMNFLDISIILHSSGLIETDIYYKPTNHHDYLDYKSHHPDHIKNNIPFNLAKRIIVFVSNEQREKIRLNELQSYFKSIS